MPAEAGIFSIGIRQQVQAECLYRMFLAGCPLQGTTYRKSHSTAKNARASCPGK